MDLKISYRHIESTPSIEAKIREKAEKLKKYFHGRINVDWICSVDGDAHHSEVTVRGDHFTYHASSAEDNLYKTIDGAMAKLKKQLDKKNTQVKEKIHRKGSNLEFDE